MPTNERHLDAKALESVIRAYERAKGFDVVGEIAFDVNHETVVTGIDEYTETTFQGVSYRVEIAARPLPPRVGLVCRWDSRVPVSEITKVIAIRNDLIWVISYDRNLHKWSSDATGRSFTQQEWTAHVAANPAWEQWMDCWGE